MNWHPMTWLTWFAWGFFMSLGWALGAATWAGLRLAWNGVVAGYRKEHPMPKPVDPPTSMRRPNV